LNLNFVCTLPFSAQAICVEMSMPGSLRTGGKSVAGSNPSGVEIKKSKVPTRGAVKIAGIDGALASKISPRGFLRLIAKLTSRMLVAELSGSK